MNTMKHLLIFFFSFAFLQIQAQEYPTVKTIKLNSKELNQGLSKLISFEYRLQDIHHKLKITTSVLQR